MSKISKIIENAPNPLDDVEDEFRDVQTEVCGGLDDAVIRPGDDFQLEISTDEDPWGGSREWISGIHGHYLVSAALPHDLVRLQKGRQDDRIEILEADGAWRDLDDLMDATVGYSGERGWGYVDPRRPENLATPLLGSKIIDEVAKSVGHHSNMRVETWSHELAYPGKKPINGKIRFAFKAGITLTQ
jgi:hypothetical protein